MELEAPTLSAEDPTEGLRRSRLRKLNPGVGRAELEHRYGQVLGSAELAITFEVIGFMAPLVVVRRRTDGRIGSFEFQHHPRFYFNWRKD